MIRTQVTALDLSSCNALAVGVAQEPTGVPLAEPLNAGTCQLIVQRNVAFPELLDLMKSHRLTFCAVVCAVTSLRPLRCFYDIASLRWAQVVAAVVTLERQPIRDLHIYIAATEPGGKDSATCSYTVRARMPNGFCVRLPPSRAS